MRPDRGERGGRLQSHDLLKVQLPILLDLWYEVHSRSLCALERLRLPGPSAAHAAQQMRTDLHNTFAPALYPADLTILSSLRTRGGISQPVLHALEIQMALFL